MIKKLFGYFLIALPFLLITLFMYIELGIGSVVAVWGAFFVICVCVVAGVGLVEQ